MELSMQSAEIMQKNFSASTIRAAYLTELWGKSIIIAVDILCTLDFIISQENCRVLHLQLADEDKRFVFCTAGAADFWLSGNSGDTFAKCSLLYRSTYV